jgi:hypothetical protein
VGQLVALVLLGFFFGWAGAAVATGAARVTTGAAVATGADVVTGAVVVVTTTAPAGRHTIWSG